MKKYILEMIDGGIKNIITDDWTESNGCPTCGYGGWNITNMTIEMEGFDLIVKAGSEYRISLPTYQDLMIWFGENLESIKEMTQDEFTVFIKESEWYHCDEITVIKGIEI